MYAPYPNVPQNVFNQADDVWRRGTATYPNLGSRVDF